MLDHVDRQPLDALRHRFHAGAALIGGERPAGELLDVDADALAQVVEPVGGVDGALERLETAFAERERAVALATIGEAAWLEQASQKAAVLTARFERAPKHRFSRVALLTQGYAVKDVDAFADRVNAYLLHGEPLSVAEVRSVTFRAARGGYEEAQVDAVLDSLIDLLLSLGNN